MAKVLWLCVLLCCNYGSVDIATVIIVIISLLNTISLEVLHLKGFYTRMAVCVCVRQKGIFILHFDGGWIDARHIVSL